MLHVMEYLVAEWDLVVNSPHFWGFVSIPIVAAVVTWAHVWLAIQMTLYPIKFVGIKEPWLGWQGIIPRKAKKMAAIVVDKTITKLGSLQEVFQQMEPEKIAHHMSSVLVNRVEEYTDEIMLERNATLWENLPLVIKARVYTRVRRQIPVIMDGLVKDMNENIDDLMDLKEMVVNRLDSDRALMVRVFKEVGQNEFNFIVNVSFWLGLFFGTLQMLLWIACPEEWRNASLPAYGAVLGYATNWVALNMVFRPLNPVKIGPFTFQGVFLKRQEQVADQFSELVTQELISIKHIMWQIFNGSKSNRTRYLIKKHIDPLISGGVVKAALQLSVGAEGFLELKQSITDKAVDLSMRPLSDPAFNKDRATIIQKIFSSRMKTLTSAEFQDLLRPAFKEDEWILIAMGAIMGLIAGVLQVVFGFH
ncbi:Conserved hypothetical protein [gamma proteobacterium HdN1]|nr:Conserved hypothetical protein [gamma proteobacterium HdN1]